MFCLLFHKYQMLTSKEEEAAISKTEQAKRLLASAKCPDSTLLFLS